jgi:hypothetical protein
MTATVTASRPSHPSAVAVNSSGRPVRMMPSPMDPKPRPSSGQTEAADDSPSRPRWPGFRLIKLAFMFGAGPVGQRTSPLIIVLFATGANGAPPGVACDRPGHLASRSLFQGGPPNHGTPRTDNRHQPSDPRAAAAAGILFSLLLGLAITLINVSAPSNPATAGDWLTDPGHRRGAQLVRADPVDQRPTGRPARRTGVVRRRAQRRRRWLSRPCAG